MNKKNTPRLRKGILLIVCSMAIVFLACGTWVSLWSAKKMKGFIAERFNEKQLVLAQNVSSSIERELNLLVKEISLLAREISAGPVNQESQTRAIQRSLSRILENGVWKIEIVESESRLIHIYTPYGHWSEKETPDAGSVQLSDLNDLKNQSVWISPLRIKPFGISLILAVSLPGDTPRLILFHINVSWFLAPFIKNIRSGETGYAWLMDEDGVFLFHPDADFVGKNAFEARVYRNPDICFEKINFIQENMLKGREGTGWYLSDWHRGITGVDCKIVLA